MFIMTKEEAQNASHVWPANVKQPVDRDLQISLMLTARERHKSTLNRIMRFSEETEK